MKMQISPQRIEEITRAFLALRRELESLHTQGQRENECLGWPECDCRLAEQIRGLTHIEEEWTYRGEGL